jgi:hypothetical protein
MLYIWESSVDLQINDLNHNVAYRHIPFLDASRILIV